MTSTNSDLAERGRNVECKEEETHLRHENGNTNSMASNFSRKNLLSTENTTDVIFIHNENKSECEDSSDDDDTLSNKTEIGDDERKNKDGRLNKTPFGSHGEESGLSISEDENEFKNSSLEDPDHRYKKKDIHMTHEGSPVFYLEPGDWEKSDLGKIKKNTRSSSSPQSFSPSSHLPDNNKSSFTHHLAIKKPNSCPRIPSPLSLTIPSNPGPGARKPIIPPSTRRLFSPQTVYNPLLSRLHQSESMQTLPECDSYECVSPQTGERVRSFSSSSNQRISNNNYRQSFGSGSFSGQVSPLGRISPLARSESAFFPSPIKRGSIFNESVEMPINNRNTSHNMKRTFPATFNQLRHRKTAIPLLCSRTAVMVRIHSITAMHYVYDIIGRNTVCFF